MTFAGGIGGNPPLPEAWLAPAAGEPGVAWLASGRDAYVLAVRLLTQAPRRWLVPTFTCPVVPDVLRAAGREVVAYRPGELAAADPKSAVVVLAWGVDRGPQSDDVAAAQVAPAVIEDRALWAGLPRHLPVLPATHLALGSARKWLGGAEGGWLAGQAVVSTALASPARTHALLALAAAACRAARQADEPAIVDAANAGLATAAEDAVGLPSEPRAMSRIGALLLAGSEADLVRQRRFAVAARLAARLQLSAPADGSCALGVLRPDRDALRARLAALGIRAPLHWSDGAWTGDAWAQQQAAQTLTLPCPSHLSAAVEATYIDAVAECW